MKKTLLFKSIALSLFMLFSIGILNAQVFITELADPGNESGARFVELFNSGSTDIDLSTGWQLQRATNGNDYYQDPVDLTGTIKAGDFYIICANGTVFTSTFGFDADQDIGTGGAADSNGDDQLRLLSPGSVVEDMFGVLEEDGSGTNHEFEDGRAERKATVTAANATYTFSEWNIWNDTGSAETTNDPQDAPDDFDPGEWIGNVFAASDLFFSEYVEGEANSNNRVIEIFNGTGAEVDLSTYTVKQSHNGTGWGVDGIAYVLPLTGTLADGDVYVIANEEADAAALAAADITFAYSADQGHKIPFFTGDDALGLFKSDVLIDVIGVPTTDPGSGWDVAGVTTATYNHTLIRKRLITEGNTDWAVSAGTDADDSEWIVLDADVIDNLGSHTFGEAPDETAPVFTSVPDDGDTEVAVDAVIVLTFDEAIRNIDDSEITDANVAALLTLKETDASGADVPFTATIDDAKKVITVTPDADLKIAQLYYAAILAVEDAANNASDASNMTFTTITKYNVTFNVDMSLVEGYDSSSDILYIAGNIAGWVEPGSNTDLVLTDTDGNMIYTIVLPVDLTADPVVSDIAYKFFLNAGWGGGEWNGDPDRTATITENTTLDHIFGNQGEPIFVNVPYVQRFGSVTAYDAVSVAGWTHANVETGGTLEWEGRSYNSDGYIQISAFSSSSTGADQVWLITPGINMDNSTSEELSFDVNIAYWNYAGLSVKISTDFDQTVAGILTATWTDVTAEFTIPSEPTGGFGDFATAGHLDVSSYAGNMYVAFVYVGNKSGGETTTYQIDNVVVAEAGTVGIDDVVAVELNIYPNPSNGKFYIEMGDTFKVNTKIEVFNVVGMKVLETITNDFKTEIDLSAMKQGIYYVRVNDGQNIVTQKVMKQ